MGAPPGTKLGRYEIRSKIGEGGMGEVYLAEDTRLHRKVALKILPADFSSNKDRMRRFEQEAQAAAALNHPNIATIHEIGESDNVNFIAMEFIDGVSFTTSLDWGREVASSNLAVPTNTCNSIDCTRAAVNGGSFVWTGLWHQNLISPQRSPSPTH